METIKNEELIVQYKKDYSDAGFWHKITTYAKKAGRATVEKALVLYYVVRDDATPQWAKSVIYGALGYFIFPLDMIPDIVPMAGFSDDLTAIVTALTIISRFIKPEHKQLAKDKATKLFNI